MNLTFSVSGELEQIVRHFDHIKWTEIARKAIREEAEKLKKLEILQKYVERKPISEAEWKWMDEIDWHPVDERNYKPGFAEKAIKQAAAKGKKIKSLDDLLK